MVYNAAPDAVFREKPTNSLKLLFSREEDEVKNTHRMGSGKLCKYVSVWNFVLVTTSLYKIRISAARTGRRMVVVRGGAERDTPENRGLSGRYSCGIRSSRTSGEVEREELPPPPPLPPSILVLRSELTKNLFRFLQLPVPRTEKLRGTTAHWHNVALRQGATVN